MTVPVVSVIVPCLGEDRPLARELEDLGRDKRIEVILAPADRVGFANRAHQMNWGARKARGELLVFLHADTRIDPTELKNLYRNLKNHPKGVGGAFRFALDSPSWKARWVEFGVRFREFLFKLPYGDQAIFVKKSVFEEIGGYREVPILEDVLLIQKLKARGQLLSFSAKAVTSARRWEQNGWLKTTLVNWGTMIFWKFGVSLERIKKFREGVFDSVPRNLKAISD